MTNYQLGQKRIRQLIDKACRIRDTKGYHENLGYEYDRSLKDYLSTLGLHYTEECNLLKEFYSACDKI